MILVLVVSLFVGISNGAMHRECQKVCTAQYDPVCGTDHKTYSSMCQLGIAECNAKMEHHYLSLAARGPCHTTNPGITTTYSCANPTICDEEISPVCGTDGVTYNNPCLLHEAACNMLKNGMHMQQVHTGECTKAEQNSDCPHYCDQALEPVCSKGNSTFRNSCFLKQMFCKYSNYGSSIASRYEVLHNGTCDGSDPTQTVKLDCSKYIVQGAIAVEGSSGIYMQCHHTTTTGSHIRHYVCSTDHHTYYDECRYCQRMASKLADDHTIDVLALGRCPSYLSPFNVIG